MARILVIDDEEIIHMALVQFLETDGHTVISAMDGHEGVSAFQSASVDIVITDILMPDKEGLETIMDLRRLNPNVRIIAMSGGGRRRSADFLQMATHLGASAVLKKPFRMQELRDALDACLVEPDGYGRTTGEPSHRP